MDIILGHFNASKKNRESTTLQSITNAKFSQYRFCYTAMKTESSRLFKRNHQDYSNDTPQTIREFQVCFPVLMNKISKDKP